MTRKASTAVKSSVTADQEVVRAPAVAPRSDADVSTACCPRCGYTGAMAAPAPIAKQEAPAVLRWRVTRGGTFAQNGTMVKVATGHVVALAAYGRDGIERMKARGITLEPIA